MQKKKTMDLTTGSVAKKLLIFAIPIILSNILQHLYTAADRAVVGQFAKDGTAALAAVGATGSAITLLLGVVSGVALGVNIVCSNLRGAGEEKLLRRSMHNALILALLCGLTVMGVGLVFCPQMLELMNVPRGLGYQAGLYMRIYFLGAPFTLVYNVSSGILRSHGDARRPMMILMVSGLLNVALNLLLVIVFKLGVAGVAIATVVANMLNAVWALLILFNPKGEFKMTAKELRLYKQESLQILKIGIPCCLNSVSFNLSNMLLQSTINSFGKVVIAGNVAADGAGGIMYQILVGFYSASVSFTGQNYGAGAHKRVDQGLIAASLYSVGAVTVLGIIGVIFSDQMLGIFNSDPAVIAAGTPKLMYYCWGYGIFAFSEVLLGCLRGIRKTLVPSIVNVAGICMTRVLWVWCIFPLKPTVGMVYLCYPISWGLSAAGLLVCYLYYRKSFVKE